MTTALSAPHQMHCLDGYLAVAERLTDLGVTIAYTPGLDRLAIYDPDTATLHLRVSATLTQYLRVVIDLWCRIVIGPEASTAHVYTPPRRLRLVT